MQKTVYIDTTIPSYYTDQRESLWLHIQRTRTWWDEERQAYQVYCSDFVQLELSEAPFVGQAEALALIAEIPRLALNSEIEQIVEVYLANYLMPVKDIRDAIHLAFASYYKLDFLLTWNIRHLANARKRAHIRVINSRLHLPIPEIITPLELLLTEDE
jgi:predicted nucleic acid-binding protein